MLIDQYPDLDLGDKVNVNGEGIVITKKVGVEESEIIEARSATGGFTGEEEEERNVAGDRTADIQLPVEDPTDESCAELDELVKYLTADKEMEYGNPTVGNQNKEREIVCNPTTVIQRIIDDRRVEKDAELDAEMEKFVDDPTDENEEAVDDLTATAKLGRHCRER